LFSTIERLRHRTSRDKAGDRFGLSAAGASGVVADDGFRLLPLCSLGDSILVRARSI
jgi:hypothetical protein